MATAALHHPLAWHLDDLQVVGSFHDGHAWAFDHIARMISGEIPFSTTTDRIGFPERVSVRFVAWAPALVATLLRPLLGPLGAFNAVLLLSPGASAVAATFLLRRLTRASPWTAAGASLAWALCPYALGCLAAGQVEKVQIWVLPLFLLALSHAISGPRRLPGLLGLLATGAVAGLTTPCTSVFLPLAAGPWALWEGWRTWHADTPPREVTHRGVRRFLAAGLWLALALGTAAASLLPAWAYYGDLRGGEAISAFEPRMANKGDLPTPTPMAQPEGVFLGRGNLMEGATDTSHVAYLGLPLLVAVGLLSLRRFPGRGVAWSLVAGGVILSLGPYLVSGDTWVLRDGAPIALPAAWLDWTGYPAGRSGMYYRAIVFASLGMAAALAGTVGRLPWKGAFLLAWIAGFGQVADGWRATQILWPRPTRPVPGLAALEAMAADPTPGAVLNLPVVHGTYEGGVYLLAATFHDRPTTGLPRQCQTYLPPVARLDALVRTALAPGDASSAAATLTAAGFRYVTWRPWLDRDRAHDLDALTRSLGPPAGDARLWYWTLPSPSPTETP